jgi:hypothetical protein
MTAAATPSTPSATSAHSGAGPSRVASVVVVRSGTRATSASGVNSLVCCSTVPFGAITALTPLVAATSTVLPCSTARTREIASCW